jgi:hypothetical protein
MVTLLGVIVAPSLTAQVTQAAPGAPRVLTVNDSVVVELVGAAVVEKSSYLFVRAARQGTQIPIEITLPTDATSPQWQSFRDHLMVSLRGRSVEASDKIKRIINVIHVAIGRDTIRASIDVGVRSRCHGKWIADGLSHEVTWIRLFYTEEWIRVRAETAIAHDSFGCPVEAP